MARHMTRPIVRYDDRFFDWLQGQVVMIEDYAYAGLDFRGDPDLVLPEDAQWGNIGKKDTEYSLREGVRSDFTDCTTKCDSVRRLVYFDSII